MADPTEQPEELEEVLRDALLNYVREHPQAMDTAEGISAWWTKGSDIETVRRVLDRLTEEGLLERVGEGRYSHYRLAKERRSN